MGEIRSAVAWDGFDIGADGSAADVALSVMEGMRAVR